jgi:hypothetical protein
LAVYSVASTSNNSFFLQKLEMVFQPYEHERNHTLSLFSAAIVSHQTEEITMLYYQRKAEA